MTSSPHGLYIQGDTRDTMDGTEGSETARWSQSQKAVLSSDWSLQFDSMTATSVHTPKISASRRQVVKGVSGGSDIVSISEPRRRVATSGGPLDRPVSQLYHDVSGSRDGTSPK